jgi:UDP-glucose 4-epimerase
LEVNAVATARLMQAAIRQGVKRFLYISSIHVYGNPLTGKVTEETKPNPVHPYAYSHRAGEDVVFSSHQSGEIEGIVIRLSNSYGAPADKGTNCWMLLANDLCCQIANTSKIILKSSVSQRRDFISITDACRAITHLLQLPTEKLKDSLFNVSGLWSPTILEMAQRVAERAKLITGKRFQIGHSSDLSTENVEHLDFRMKKLTDTGFSLSAGAIIDEEIDRLIRFCLTYMKN